MKRLGILGGMSWESSAEYYRIINQAVQQRLGGFHSADCVMHSLNFAEIEAYQSAGDWDSATQRLIEASQGLQKAGAQGLVIATNTMHKLADDVQAAIDIPLLHIADATAAAIQAQNVARFGLLGTRFTMQQPFMKDRLRERFGLDVRVPDEAGIRIVDDIIYGELVRGVIRDESRRAYQGVIAALVEAGAEGVILGCTEISLLIQAEHSPVPVFDTTLLHAQAAVDWALEKTQEP